MTHVPENRAVKDLQFRKLILRQNEKRSKVIRSSQL